METLIRYVSFLPRASLLCLPLYGEGDRMETLSDNLAALDC